MPPSGLHTPIFDLADRALGATSAGLAVLCGIISGDGASDADDVLPMGSTGSGVLEFDLISSFSNLLFNSLNNVSILFID